VLVARGDQHVVNSVASNAGARFSDFGFCTWSSAPKAIHPRRATRSPQGHPEAGFPAADSAKASEDVKKTARARAARDRRPNSDSVADVTGALQSKFGPVSRSYFVAKRLVMTQHSARQF